MLPLPLEEPVFQLPKLIDRCGGGETTLDPPISTSNSSSADPLVRRYSRLVLLPESDSSEGAEPIVWMDPDVVDTEDVEGFIGSLAPSTPRAPEPTPAIPSHPEPVPNSPITGTVVQRGDAGATYVVLLPTLPPSNGFCERVTPVEVELWILEPLDNKEP